MKDRGKRDKHTVQLQLSSVWSLDSQGSDKRALAPALLISLSHVVTHVHCCHCCTKHTLFRLYKPCQWLPSVPKGPSILLFVLVTGHVLILSSTGQSHVTHTHTHTHSLFPHYLLFALGFSESFPSAASVCMWQRIWGLIQSARPFPFWMESDTEREFKNLQISEVLNQIWITVGGREREESESGGGFRLHEDGEGKKPKIFPYSDRFYYEDHQTRRSFSCKYVSHCAGVGLCVRLSELANFLWLVLHESKAWTLVEGVKACLKDSYCFTGLHCMVQNLCY